MKNALYLFTIILLILSCNSDVKTIKGDLYFKLINLTPSEGMSEKQEVKFNKLLDSVKSNSNISTENNELLNNISLLKKLDLLNAPFINLKMKDESVKTIYLSKKEYDKVKMFNMNDLLLEQKKVSIDIEVKVLEGNIWFSDKINTIQKNSGTTFWSK